MSVPSKAKSTAAGKPKTLKATWASDAHLPLQFADNLKLIVSNDQVYLTFGQLDFATGGTQDPAEVPDLATIQPLARFVLTQQAMSRIARILGDHASPDLKDA